MTVRAKFKCTGNEDVDNGKRITLEAVTSGSPENDSFFKYTPSARVSLGTVNLEAAAQFEVGKEYYGDFSPAWTPEVADAPPAAAAD